jgi:hypothetical protein
METMFTLEGRLEKWLAWTKTYNWSSFGSDLPSKSDEILQGFKHAKLHQKFDQKNCLKLYQTSLHLFNPFTASCENAMTLSVPGVPASCEKFPHSSQLNFWSTESIFNQFSVFLKILNALCVCLQYKHPNQWKESLGQTSQSLCSSFSGRTNATSALSLGVA